MLVEEELEAGKEESPSTLWELCISGDVEGVREAVERGDQVHCHLLSDNFILTCRKQAKSIFVFVFCLFGVIFIIAAGECGKRFK